MSDHIVLKLALLLILTLHAPLLLAQTNRNAVEMTQNQQAIAANEAQMERDLKELKVFKTKLDQLEQAYVKRNLAVVASLKTDLVNAMEREIDQSERKIAQDKQEVAQSESELAASNRETRRSRIDRATRDNNAKDGIDVRDDRRDSRDDQSDLMDDKDDLEKQILRTKRQKEIFVTLKAFNFSFDPSIAEKAVANKALLREFSLTMEKDIAATKLEIEEDKREALEDTRERKEDRRERLEKRRNKNN